LFDADRKRPLPVLPRGIGVVTSADGAALRDILRVLTVRHPSARIVIRPAHVQGEGAAEDLVRGLRAIAKVPGVEVVIIGRGGGSAEDLWAFNDEALARAISRCPVPVISAVGHEVDFTIADFVADVRAATPSNAAEIVVERADHVYARIDRAERRLASAMELAVVRRRRRADSADAHLRRWPTSVVLRVRDAEQLELRLRHAARGRLTRLGQHVDAWRARLDRQHAHRVLARWRTRTSAADAALHQAATRRRLEAAARAGALAARLDALSPLAVLGRGYAICWNDARTGIIRSSSTVRSGDALHVTLADGEIDCRVE
jgi:exodeoxyribonuclease VII large subunit